METGSNTLNQITHMQFDFMTPKSLKITPSDGKKKKKLRERSKKRKTREWRKIKTDIPFNIYIIYKQDVISLTLFS